MLSVGVKNFFYVLDVLTQIYFRLIRNLCTFAIKMAKVLAFENFEVKSNVIVNLVRKTSY